MTRYDDLDDGYDDLDDGYDDLDRDYDDACPGCGRVHCTCDDGRCDECETWGEFQCSRHADVYIETMRALYEPARRSITRDRRRVRDLHRAAAERRAAALAARNEAWRRSRPPYFGSGSAWYTPDAPALPPRTPTRAELASWRDMDRSTGRILHELSGRPRGRRR